MMSKITNKWAYSAQRTCFSSEKLYPIIALNGIIINHKDAGDI